MSKVYKIQVQLSPEHRDWLDQHSDKLVTKATHIRLAISDYITRKEAAK